MFIKLNRFLFFQQPPPPPPSSWWSSSPSPSPSTSPSPNQKIMLVLSSILERLKNHVKTDMFLSLFKTHLVVVGSTKATIITTLILGGGLLVVCLVFLPGPTLVLLYYLSLACFYLCLGILGLLCLICYYLFKVLCFALEFIFELLSVVLSLTCRWLLSALRATYSLFLRVMSRWLFPAERTRPSWVSRGWSVTCRWASTVLSVARRWLLSSCYWARLDSKDRDEEDTAGAAGPEPSSAKAAPENRPSSSDPHREGNKATRPENRPSSSGPRREGSKSTMPENRPSSSRPRREGSKSTTPENRPGSSSEPYREGSDPVVIDRQKMKESDVFKRAMEEEWAARHRELERQAEEARRQRSSKRAQNVRPKTQEKRKKQRVGKDEPQTSRTMEDEETLKDTIRDEIMKDLSKLKKYDTLDSLLRVVGIPIRFKPSRNELREAYRQACQKFHPDKLIGADLRHRIQSEETLKLINKLKTESEL